MMDAFYRRCLIPAFERLLKRRQTFAYLRALEHSQWSTPERLRQAQLAALQQLVAHAAENCIYYREAWRKQGLRPGQIQSLEDFRCWPVTGRETVRTDRLAMRSSQHQGKLLAKATGGSSGDPVRFDLDGDSNDRRTAAWHRGYGWAGAELGTRQLYLWGIPLTSESSLQRLKRRCYDRWLYRRRMLNSFELSETTVDTFFDALQRFRPQTVVAYTNPLYAFARMLERRGLQPHTPRSIVVGAEKLHPFQRTLIERVFAAPVFETYGSREFMLIASECDRHAGLHITSEHLLVEILDDEGQPVPPGHEGNVVITDLFNYGMPFIRYANGDRAVASDRLCPCGRSLPLLQKIVGRKLDVIETIDGRHIPGEFFPHLIKDYPGIDRFQVVQRQRDELRLHLVTNNLWQGWEEAELTRRIGGYLGPAMRLVVQPVCDIPYTRAGKLQVVRREAGEARASDDELELRREWAAEN